MPSFYRQASTESQTYRPSASPTMTPAHLYEEKVPNATLTPPSTITLSNTEMWTLYHFEKHAISCSSCRDPYGVHRAHGRLCSAGSQLAQSAVDVIFSRAKTVGQQATPVMVEVPTDYVQVRSLVQALERSLRHPNQHPIVNMRRSRTSASKERSNKAETPRRSSTVSASSEHKTKEQSRHHSPARSSTSTAKTSSTRQSSKSSTPSSPKRHSKHTPASSPSPRRTPEIVDWPEDEDMTPAQPKAEASRPSPLRPIIKHTNSSSERSEETPATAFPSQSRSSPSTSPTGERSVRFQKQPALELRRKRQQSPKPKSFMGALFGGYDVVEVRSKRVRA